MLSLESDIGSLPGIGPANQNKLLRLQIRTVEDLLYHFPIRYQDSSQIQSADSLVEGELATVTGYITQFHSKSISRGRSLQFATFSDDSGSVRVTWFNQPFLKNTLQVDLPINLHGKVTLYQGNLTLSSPQFELLSSNSSTTSIPIHTGRLVPIYHLTSGITNKWLRRLISNTLKSIDGYVSDFLPKDITHQHNFPHLIKALQDIHFPENLQDLEIAKNRLSFDEMLIYQLVAQYIKTEWSTQQTAYKLKSFKQDIDKFIETLPFKLTPDQITSSKQILSDISTKTPMHRLLQGDVGSGKTIVAAIAAYNSVLNNKPVLIMAPTSVLAQQHYQTFSQLFDKLNISISLQTSSSKKPINHSQIIIGTHALLHRQLPDDIGLVIIDEQHKFGVSQRSQLLESKIVPHLLSMTATPIPRTVALTLYAQLDISTINTMPPGRMPVKTWVVPESKRIDSYTWISSQIKKLGAQIYYVCPLIQDSTTPKLDQVKAVDTQYHLLKDKIFPTHSIDLLHGQMSAKHKNLVLDKFRAGETQVLVSTPVIEVGVDVKKASIIVIESAERFGLASLHQLRGRVGRSDQQSYCLLFASTSKSNLQRLKSLETIHQGSKLAQVDLDIRGPGHLFGTQQSGYIDLKIASLTDLDLIQSTHSAANSLISNDPKLLSHQELLHKVQQVLEKSTLAD